LGLDEADAALATRVAPLRAVLDSQLQTPANAKVLAGSADTVLFHSADCAIPDALSGLGHNLQPLPCGAQGLNLSAMVNVLCQRQCNEILVESGPRLAGAMLDAGLLDELIIYMAPVLMGDRARPLLALPLDSMSQKVQLDIQDVRKVGQDWRFTVVPI
jgi:diaminohydroxyphosphoribosylaminopyrimidine deaminase/5-amino-6-(5-phosphoribosylamino)uracil reductase